MAILKVARMGHPVLRRKCEAIAPDQAVRAANPAAIEYREDGVVCAARLWGEATPIYGVLREPGNARPAPGRDGTPGRSVEFSGDGLLRYGVPVFPGSSP